MIIIIIISKDLEKIFKIKIGEKTSWRHFQVQRGLKGQCSSGSSGIN